MLTDIFEKEKALFEDGVQTVLRTASGLRM